MGVPPTVPSNTGPGFPTALPQRRPRRPRTSEFYPPASRPDPQPDGSLAFKGYLSRDFHASGSRGRVAPVTTSHATPGPTMTLPDDHGHYLARNDFRVPAGGNLTEGERQALARYGRWMEALEGGLIHPMTPSQEQFVRVARGDVPPSTEHEWAWVKYTRMRGDASHCFNRLARARREALAVEAEYSARRAAVLALVREQLDAIDAQFDDRLKATAEAAAACEAVVRDFVLQAGRSFNLAGIRAAYNPGRTNWDSRGLESYAAQHPEVNAYRKAGKPFVALRFEQPGPSLPAPETQVVEAK